MGKADYLALGDWNAKCDKCGFKFKASMLKLEWDNLYVCPSCWEIRHPQDFVRGVQDVQTPPWVRPDPAPTYILTCLPSGIVAISGYAVSGCMICGQKTWPGFPTQGSP